MYDILKNLYYVSFFALILQFAGLYQPFAVLFGLTLLYLAFADLFQQEEIDRLRRMNYISYKRRPDVTVAFVAMTLTFGLYHLATGLNMGRRFPFWLLVVGTIGAIYIVIEPYLPRGQRGRGRHLRSL